MSVRWARRHWPRRKWRSTLPVAAAARLMRARGHCSPAPPSSCVLAICVRTCKWNRMRTCPSSPLSLSLSSSSSLSFCSEHSSYRNDNEPPSPCRAASGDALERHAKQPMSHVSLWSDEHRHNKTKVTDELIMHTRRISGGGRTLGAQNHGHRSIRRFGPSLKRVNPGHSEGLVQGLHQLRNFSLLFFSFLFPFLFLSLICQRATLPYRSTFHLQLQPCPPAPPARPTCPSQQQQPSPTASSASWPTSSPSESSRKDTDPRPLTGQMSPVSKQTQGSNSSSGSGSSARSNGVVQMSVPVRSSQPAGREAPSAADSRRRPFLWRMSIVHRLRASDPIRTPDSHSQE